MKIVIVGGGKIGFYLTKTLLPYKHSINIIEKNQALCVKIANDLNIPVINGDGTKIDDLSAVDTDKADILIAVTGKDEDNLIACQLAKRKFGVKRTIARVNNPKNIIIYKTLGVEAVSSTSIIADLIEQEVDYYGVKTLMKLKDGKITLSETSITADSPVCGKSLREIELPRQCIVISIIRDEDVIIPNGFTTLEEGDFAIVVSSQEDQQELRDYFVGQ